MAITHLRPHSVFDRLTLEDRRCEMVLPSRVSLTTMLERAVLVSLVRMVQPQRMFEFGTFLGETTYLMAANSLAEVVTLDLSPEAMGGSLPKLDECERNNACRGRANEPVFAGTACQHRIRQLAGDSTRFDCSDYHNQVDFILVDGGHGIDVVTSDTDRAFRMLNRRRRSCIVWHDYGNPKYEITAYLDSLSCRHALFHVEETQYVFLFNDPSVESRTLFLGEGGR